MQRREHAKNLAQAILLEVLLVQWGLQQVQQAPSCVIRIVRASKQQVVESPHGLRDRRRAHRQEISDFTRCLQAVGTAE